jgi:plastocyanin domain-containing protein
MDKNKSFVVISIFIALVLIGVSIWSSRKNAGNNEAIQANNVSIVNGKQIIEIKAKGGYLPRQSEASAGVPTVLRFDTDGTFDCSASVRVPSLGISKILPQSGTTDIDIGTPKAGPLQGMCGMGMYPFEIIFN